MPHLSRRIFKPEEQDGMLFDFGIHHLHLGAVPDTKYPALIRGGDKILYCLVDEGAFYFLAIDNHGRWSDPGLLRIIKDSFPQKLEPYEVRGICGLAFDLPEKEREKFRKLGLNAMIELDGKFYAPPGGGITLAKTSAMSVMERNDHELDVASLGRCGRHDDNQLIHL